MKKNQIDLLCIKTLITNTDNLGVTNNRLNDAEKYYSTKR